MWEGKVMKTKVSAVLICAALSLTMTACSAKNSNSADIGETVGADGIQSVTAITEVFGTGQQVTAVAVEYGTVIDSGKLSLDDYSVSDRTIARVYANTEPVKSEIAANGNYVIVELDAAVPESAGQGMQDRPQGAGTGQRPDFLPENRPAEDRGEPSSNPMGGGVALGSAGDGGEPSNHLTTAITQNKDIVAENGQVIWATGGVIENASNINLVVDDFEQLVFTDSNYGNQELMYNLYVPKNYDENKSYPLILFMVDAGGVSTDPVKTLTQGLGAVIWATPEEQAKHECFVLAPQYTRVMADDNSETTEDMDITVNLIRDLISRYNIDENKIYNTGQSMGCMTSIAMNIKYPDLFAASFLVAGQWDASLVAPMADKPLWIVVCEGDTKASPGMDAITAELAANGATVSKATWDSAVSDDRFDTYVADMLAKGCGVNYTVFEGGSHTYTWQVAYTIEGIRDWLFEQAKP
jgi:predicted peptidase